MNILLKFGSTVKEVREKRGLSQETLAEKCGLHRTYISSIENGKRNISLVNIQKIEIALDIKLINLIEKDNNEKK